VIMILVRDTKEVYRHQVESAVGENASAKQVLDYLFGTYPYYDTKTNFVIREWEADKERTPLHRLNMFWAIPLTVLCMPYQYIVRGHMGWDTKTAFGRWILRVTGHLKEVFNKPS